MASFYSQGILSVQGEEGIADETWKGVSVLGVAIRPLHGHPLPWGGSLPLEQRPRFREPLTGPQRPRACL